MVAVHEVNLPRRAAGRHHQRVEVVLCHDGVNALRPRQAAVRRQRLQVGRLRERPLLLGHHQQLLPEVRHLLLAVRLVKSDQLFQAVDLRLRAERR